MLKMKIAGLRQDKADLLSRIEEMKKVYQLEYHQLDNKFQQQKAEMENEIAMLKKQQAAQLQAFQTLDTQKQSDITGLQSTIATQNHDI